MGLCSNNPLIHSICKEKQTWSGVRVLPGALVINAKKVLAKFLPHELYFHYLLFVEVSCSLRTSLKSTYLKFCNSCQVGWRLMSQITRDKAGKWLKLEGKKTNAQINFHLLKLH